MKKIMSLFIAAFYIGIMFFIALGMRHIDEFDNFAISMVFQIIADVALIGVICLGLFSTTFKTPYFISLMCTSGTLVFINNIVNIFLLGMKDTFLILINLILLFIYCCVSIPALLTGMKK